MNFFRPGGVPVMRLVSGERVVLPTVDEILALRGITGSAAATEVVSRIRSRVRFPHAAVEGEVETIIAGDDRLRVSMDLGQFGQSVTVLNGDRGSVESSSEMQPFMELTGEDLRQARLEHPAVTFGDWRTYFDAVDVLRTTEVEGRRVYAIRLRSEGLPDRTVTVDAETGDILRIDRVMILPGGIGRLPVMTTYEDYREVDGARVPFRSVETNEAMGRTINETLSLENGVELEADLFAVEIPERPR